MKDSMQAAYCAKIDSRGRVTVAPEVRRWLGLSTGDRVEFVIEGEIIIPRPLRPNTSEFLVRSTRARNR